MKKLRKSYIIDKVSFGQGLNFPLSQLSINNSDLPVIVKSAQFIAVSADKRIKPALSSKKVEKTPALVMPQGMGSRHCCTFNSCRAFSYSHVKLYLVYLHQEDLDCALRDYNKAIELNPDHAYAYNNRGVVYQKQDEVDSAIEDYNKAIELKLDNPHVYYKRGTAWLQLREWEKAKLDLTTAKKEGTDIGFSLRFDYKGIPGFEEKYGELPEDILAMLTLPQT